MNVAFKRLFATAIALAGTSVCIDALAQALPQLPAPQDKSGTVGASGVYDLMELGGAKLSAGDAAGAYSDLSRLVSMPEFAAAPDTVRFGAYVGLAYAEAMLGKDADALAHVDLAEPLGGDTPAFWQVYLQVSAATNNVEKAVHAAARIATDYPELAVAWDDAFIFLLLRESRDLEASKSDRIVLLDALWRTGYRPVDATRSIEPYWVELLDARVEEGNVDQARLVASTLSTPDAIKALSIDARYAGVAPTNPTQLWLEAANKEIIRLGDLADEQPEKLKPVATLATWLNRVARTEEALAVVDEALARIAAAPTGVSAFEDQAKFLQWLHNQRSVALMSDGRYEEAIAAQEEAWKVASAIEPGAVAQAVNLAEMYLFLGNNSRATDILATAKVELASDFGRMALNSVRACVAHQLGDDAAAESDIAAMRDVWTTGYGPLANAVLCVESEDDAAKFVIDSLENKDVRNNALDLLQKGIELETRPDFKVDIDRRLEALRQRGDIKAAVAKYGVILDWPYVF